MMDKHRCTAATPQRRSSRLRIQKPTGAEEKVIFGFWPSSFIFNMTALYLGLFIIRPWEMLFPWLSAIHFERVFALVTLLAIIVSPKSKIRLPPLSASIILFAVAITLAALNALDQTLAWNTVYKLLPLLFMFFIITWVVRTPHALACLIAAIIFFMGLYLCKSLWEFTFHGSRHYRMGVVRLLGIESTYGGPNWLAASIYLTFPFLSFLWTSTDLFSNVWSRKGKRLKRNLLIFYAFLAVISLILTNSRGGIIGLIAFCVLKFAGRKSISAKLKFLSIAFLAGIIIWSLLGADTQNRYISIWNPAVGPENAHASTMGRIEGIKMGLEISKHYPLLGIGPDNFLKYRVAKLDGIALQPHNLVALLLSETGIIGTVCFSWLLYSIFRTAKKTSMLAKNLEGNYGVFFNGLSVACRELIWLLLLEGLANHNLLRGQWLWVAAFISLGLTMASDSSKKKTASNARTALPLRNTQ
jgi:O-antigen ligase